MEVSRTLDLGLENSQSCFLWGPRKTGKSHYLKKRYSNSIRYDFLDTQLQLEFMKRPALLREQLTDNIQAARKHPVILDEVQKVPRLMDEVHWLIENEEIQFILCGSSPRKLVREHANLLGGRAWRSEMLPLASKELPNLDLLRAMNQGLIPSHYLQGASYTRSLRAYVQDYLKEEVFSEGLARNLPAFSRFLDAVSYGHGELTNFATVSRECGASPKTVKEYYQILADTLVGSFLEPYKLRQSRDVIVKASKFYLFDTGVANSLCKRKIVEERGEAFGKSLEHFILMELRAYRAYSYLDFEIRFWRTKYGLEVDFILGDGEIALEVKGSSRIDNRELHGIRAFTEKYRPKQSIVVSNEKRPRIVGKSRIVPWKLFLEELWSGDIIR